MVSMIYGLWFLPETLDLLSVTMLVHRLYDIRSLVLPETLDLLSVTMLVHRLYDIRSLVGTRDLRPVICHYVSSSPTL